MNKLLWFQGITWDTPVNEIGWAYVLLAILILLLGVCVGTLIGFDGRR